MKTQMTVFDTNVTEACDDVIEAFKNKKDADDRLEVTRKHLAGLLKEKGLGHKESIKHDNKVITLKIAELKDDTVTLKNVKE